MSRRQLVLHLLREAGAHGVTTQDFLNADCGSRFGGRLFELREQGHVIDAEPLRPGSYRYTLVRDAERDTTAPDSTKPDVGMAVAADGVSLGAASSVRDETPRPAPDDSPASGAGIPADDDDDEVLFPSSAAPDRLFDVPRDRPGMYAIDDDLEAA